MTVSIIWFECCFCPLWQPLTYKTAARAAKEDIISLLRLINWCLICDLMIVLYLLDHAEVSFRYEPIQICFGLKLTCCQDLWDFDEVEALIHKECI